MRVLGFSHYNLRAHRAMLDALHSFYVDVIGLEHGERPPFARFGYWLYVGPRDVLHLTEASAEELRLTQTVTTFDHVAFNCVGREQFEARLVQFGVRYEVAHVPQTNQVQLFFKDPAGNGVELQFASEGDVPMGMLEWDAFDYKAARSRS